MAVENFTDPRTRKEVTFVSGKIEGVYFNELKSVKTYSGPNGPWTPTHTVNVVVDGTRVGFGLTDKDKINSKDAEGNYHALAKGMEVSVEITDIGEYNGNPQYSSKASKVTVLDATAEPQQAAGGSKTAYTAAKRDNSGMSTGHAINVAMNVLASLDDAQAIIEEAKKAHALTTKLKKEYAEKNPDMSDYDVGAMTGQSILSASHYAETVEDIEAFARQTLDVIVPAVSAYVKGTAEDSKPAAKKTAAKKTPAKKKTEPTPERVDDEDIPESAFEDDGEDLPF